MLLVISGHLNQANQRELQTRVGAGASYGRVLVNGDNLEDDILAAIREAQRFCDNRNFDIVLVSSQGREKYN